MPDLLLKELKNSTNSIYDLVNSITNEDALYKPDPNFWSICEVLEHLWKVDEFVKKSLADETADQLNDGPLELFGVEKIKAIFLSTENKFTSPELIVPTRNFKNIEVLKVKFKTNRAELESIIKLHFPIFKTSYFKHPRLGDLTKYEWVYFIIYHTQRHLAQMKRVLDKIKQEKL